jgi:hypothetical protein
VLRPAAPPLSLTLEVSLAGRVISVPILIADRTGGKERGTEPWGARKWGAEAMGAGAGCGAVPETSC